MGLDNLISIRWCTMEVGLLSPLDTPVSPLLGHAAGVIQIAKPQEGLTAVLVKLFAKHEAAWVAAAKETKDFIGGNFPKGALIRRDDVAKALIPILEVNEVLRDELDGSKLRGKFWISFFADLIIDRSWDKI